jgi:peptide/nickel transport system substrate-binding protein
VAVLCASLAALAACGGERAASPGAESEPRTTASQPGATAAPESELDRGGTLRVGLVDFLGEFATPYGLDPQADYFPTGWELFRCCLLRTLLSYNGRPTAEGGAELRPDLAVDLPTITADGLSWIFRLEPGLHYAPPYQDTEIVAADVVRAIERTLRPAPPALAEGSGASTIGAYADYYRPLIEGSEEFAAGEADTISGLESPDEHTLVVHLTEPAGDLGHRFSLAATAPIPPQAADRHDDGYGPYLVASGPYMMGSYKRGRAITLVRNPSWEAASDGLRAGYADRIELTIGADAEKAYALVDGGDLDLVLDQSAPAALAERYRADPALRERLIVIPQDSLFYVAMNLAQPPFDDVHVRRAANLAVNKQALVERFARGARAATHVAPDSLEGNLLLDYDPYPSEGDRGDLAAARAEMAASRYDTDGDGRCDQPACVGIRAIAIGFLPEFFPPDAIDLLQRDLEQLGLELEVDTEPVQEAFPALEAQTERHGLVLNYGWAKDFPNGSSWFSQALDGDHPNGNPSLVGFDAEQLATWGYPVTSVPSMHAQIAECIRLVGGAQTKCWAGLDQLVMEQIVPWIPYALQNETRIVSARVASFSIDQFTLVPSLDRIALEPG